MALRRGPFSLGQWCLLAALAMGLYTFRLGSARTLTDHETYVAAPAKQMAESGDWLAPRMGEDLWLEKPPLPHWLVNVAALVTGRFDETTARLPSALAGVGVVLITAWIAARLFSPSVGFLAGLLQITSVFMLQSARQAVVDIQLALLVVACIAVFVDLHFCGGLTRPGARWRVWLFWLLVGLTNLSKGPLFGAALVLVTCGGWLVLQRHFGDLRRMASPVGILLAALIAAAWPVAVGMEYPEAWELWRQHLFGRFSGTDLPDYHRPFWYYIPSAAWQWLPWTPFIVAGAAGSLAEARRTLNSPHRFIWWWFLGQFILLSCSAGKNHYYLIHALPALAPVAALGMQKTCEQIARGLKHTRRLGGACIVVATVGAVVLPVAAGYAAPEPLDRELVVLAPLLAALAIALGIALLRSRAQAALTATCALVVVGELYAVGWIMHHRDPSLIDRQFFSRVHENLQPDDLLLGTDHIGVPRYVFYVHHPVVGYLDPRDVPPLPPGKDHAYVLARAWQAAELARLGHVEQVAQSPRTRRENGPQDRFTLFRIDRTNTASRTSAPRS